MVNDAGDTAQTPLIQLTTPTVTDSSGNAIGKSVNINYSGLRTALGQKADAEVPQFFMNYYFRYPTLASTDPTKLVYLTYMKGSQVRNGIPGTIPVEGATIGLNIGNLETALTAKAPLNNPTFTGTVSGVSKSMVGLCNVNNTSDTDKPSPRRRKKP